MATPVGSVVARLIRAGYPEATARRIASGELPMDTASRMQRAQEQGFNTDEVQYHGTSSDFSEFTPSTVGNLGAGIYTTPDANNASSRAALIKFRKDLNPNAGPNVLPLLTRSENPLEVTGNPLRVDTEHVRDQGFDSIVRRDSATGDVVETNNFNPQNVRSVNAAFDPEQIGSSNILAGLGGAGVVGAGLMASDEVSASPLDDPERAERRANLRAVQVASDTLERLRRERGAVASPLQDTRMARFGDYLTENRPSEMDPVQRALQSLGLFQGLGEYLRTTGEGQRTTTMQDINAALDAVPL